MAFNAKYNKNRSVNARDAGFSQSKTFSPPLSSSSSSFGMEFCPVDTFLRGAWQVWRKLWSRSGQTWSLKLFPNVIRTVMGTGKLESLGSAANLESFECVSPNFRGFWPSRKFSRNPNDFKTFGPSLNPRVIVSLSLLCLHFPLTISSTFSVSIPSSKRKIVRLRPWERSNRILPFFLFQRIKKDNPTQLLKYTDSKIIKLLPFRINLRRSCETIPSSIHEWNRNETNLVEQREEREKRKKERRVRGAYIRGFHWSLHEEELSFSRGREKEIYRLRENTKSVAANQRASGSIVDERQREEEEGVEGLFWSVETHRSANEVISFSRWGRRGGTTHPSSEIAVCCSELARQNKLIGDINEERRERWRGANLLTDEVI